MKELRKKENSSTARSQQQHSIYEIREAFDTYWANSEFDPKAKGSGYKQFKRWENLWSHMVDADGMLPTPKELWDSYINKERGIGSTNPTSDWSPLGPNRPGVLSGSFPGTGRVNTVIVDPNDANTWYAGAPAGGIWKSTDAGANWENLFDDFPQIGVSGIAIDASNSNIVYIATGDDDAGDSFSAGVFKSLDGGNTWNETGLNPGNSNVGRLMNEIFINPTNPDIVFVGSTQGLFRTLDGGDNWESILNGNIDDFRLKPNDPNTIYVIANNDQYSKSVDGGDTFTQITDILPTNAGRSVLEVTEANPDVLYILMAETFGNGGGFLGLFKSTDSGETFTASTNTTNIFEANQTFFNLALEVSPTDENLLFTGALNIWRSNNGGDSFSRVNQWFINDSRYTHADIHFIRYFDDILFVGSDGGLYISSDNGNSFQARTENMQITQFYRIDIADNSAERIAGGTQDNSGFVLNDGEWNVYTGGDGMDYEIDPNNPNLIYGFTQFGGALFITTNAGQSTNVTQAPTDDNGNTIQGNWITPLTISSDGTVYSGYDGVYRLDGSQWVRISEDFGTGNLEDLEAHPTDPNILFAAENDVIFRSVDGGVTFNALNIFDSQISSFAINPNDPNIIYVTTSNRVGISQSAQQNSRGVFKITINGNNAVEEDITLNLPNDQAFFSIVAQGRHTDNPVYVGTNLGIYRLDDTLTEWEEYFTGLPTVAIGDLEISLSDEALVAATYGRGAWKSPIPVQIPDNDVRLVSLSPDTESILCGEIFPEIIIENNGANPFNEVDVSFTLNNGNPSDFTQAISLNPNETGSISLPSIVTDGVSLNELSVTVSIPNDSFSDNNTSSKSFFSNEFGFGNSVNTFESQDDALITFNSDDFSSSVWEQGVPTGTILNQAASGTQVYATNLDGNHPNGTTSFLVSECYELSSILAPVLKFNMAFDLELNFDLVFVQYSSDDGQNWEQLGSINSQPNWYNSDRTNASSGGADCQNCPGGQWTGTDATITEYAYDFVLNASLGETDLTNEDNILFRIVFQSDPSVTEEGVIIDDLVVEGVQDDDDDDNDGVLDIDDNCPLIGNANQTDNDQDGMGDVCDDDDDNDGIIDSEDNCPLMANTDQADADGDGIGDVCDTDTDNDGVPNDIDECPDTPIGTPVDVTGCPVFTLPADNFIILTGGESCISSNNGRVEISTENPLDYTATLTGNGIDLSQNFTTEALFDSLEAGSYSLCITIANQPDYEFCSQLLITQPEPLSVFASLTGLNNQVNLTFTGSDVYTIILNGETYRTSEDQIELPLNNTENTIVVQTDLECQGVFSKTIFLNENIFIYPNPINENGEFTVLIGNTQQEEENIRLSIYTANGTEIQNKIFPIVDGKVTMSINGHPNGVYVVNIEINNRLLNYKIIKR